MKRTQKHPFIALQLALELVAEIAPIIREIRKKDPRLARQMTDALNSIPSNVGEGNRRLGKDRIYHFTVAAGSAGELDVQLRLAIGWGHVTAERCEKGLGMLDRELAMLWRLTH